MTEKQMAKSVGFKYYNYVSTVKTTILEKKGYLAGPYYYLNFRKISKVPVNRLLIFILFNKKYTYSHIIKLIKNIECWSFFYPLQESTFNEMIVSIYSTNHDKILKIMKYFKDQEIIYHYSVYELNGNLNTYNPKFHMPGSKENEETRYDIDSIQFNNDELKPDFSEDELNQKYVKLSNLDTRLLMYLQSGFKNTELSKLMKHDAKIKDSNGDNPFVWGYNSWRYSYEKIKKNNLIKKFYIVYPLPKNLCSYFFMLIKGNDLKETKMLASNVGANTRTLKSGNLVRSLNEHNKNEIYWCAHIRSHPIFMHKISCLLDIPQVQEKNILHARSVSKHQNEKYPVPYMNYYIEQSLSLENEYYDHKKQAVNYDYDKFYDKIKKQV